MHEKPKKELAWHAPYKPSPKSKACLRMHTWLPSDYPALCFLCPFSADQHAAVVDPDGVMLAMQADCDLRGKWFLVLTALQAPLC